VSGDFPRVQESAAGSRLAGLAEHARQIFLNAWRTSAVGAYCRAQWQPFRTATGPARIRWCATALAVAAAGHLGLRLLLSPTVAPGLPAPIVAGMVIAAAGVARKAEAFDRAWRHSRLARLVR
jgi:hypothetical protein